MKVNTTAVQPESIEQLAVLLLAQARAANQRRVLLLAGEREWAIEQAQFALASVELLPMTGWLGDLAPDGVSPVVPSKVSRLLGQELAALVVDAYAGFDPDAVGAAVGALRGGGLLLLLTPPLSDWAEYPDPEHARIAVAPYDPKEVSGRFLGRLARVLAESVDVHRFEQGRPLPMLPPFQAAPPVVAVTAPYASKDQHDAVAALVKTAGGRARRPLLLIADRGRGKSAAFGIAAAQLLTAGTRKILVTGPRLEAVQAVFEHAARLLPQAQRQSDALLLEDGCLRFMAPDALMLERPDADLLLVDEAAALPVPLLTRLLSHYPRMAFATTVHGYEGTGRGFLLRFAKSLGIQTPGWRQMRLETPIRWAPEDPLERLSFRLLLLDAEAVAEEKLATANMGQLRIERLDRDALADDESRLSELFGLLLQAHYRTRPFDLRHLLDGPNVEVYGQFCGEHVVGAALVVLEGGLEPDISTAIAKGERRLRGHLIPQSLAFHLGLVDGAGLRCARIMRLAVHPAWQRRGLGGQLLAAVVAEAKTGGHDLIGSSFGGGAALLRFWQCGGFTPVRVGMTRTGSSGEHALLVLQGLGPSGQALLGEARRRFLRNLPDQLMQPLRQLEPLLALRLLAGFEPEALDGADWQQLTAFALGRRSYGDSLGALRRFLLVMGGRQESWSQLSSQQLELLVTVILQGRDWAEAAALVGLTGRAEVLKALRQALARLLEADR